MLAAVVMNFIDLSFYLQLLQSLSKPLVVTAGESKSTTSNGSEVSAMSQRLMQ